MRHFLLCALGAATLACGGSETPPGSTQAQACGVIAPAGAPSVPCGGAANGGVPGAPPLATGGAPPAMGTGAPAAGGFGSPSASAGGATGAGGAIGAGAIGAGGTSSAGAPPWNGFGGVSGAPGVGGTSGADPSTAVVPFSSISMLLAASCGGTTCHTTRQKPMLVNNASLHSTLLDTVVSECGGAHLVVPGNPDGSAIIQLVNRRCTKSGRAFYMPRNCTTNPCLPAAQLQTLTQWIQAGALGT